MVGIIGYFNGDKKKTKLLLDKMIKKLLYTNKEQINKFEDNFLSIARVSHGVINPEKQPMFNENKSMCIFMEGEVFDYEDRKKELIAKGHKFKYKHNSAEYCLHAYEEFGEKVLKEFNGSFLIVIYKIKNKELIFITDKLSWRPFYYYITKDGNLLFGTQISSIIQSEKFERELELKSIHEFFTFQRVLGNKTFYKNLYMSLPATISIFKNGKITHDSYWRMDYKPIYNSKKICVEELSKALKKAIDRRINNRNYNFGILLGGGLDARSIMAGSDKEITAFTYGTYKNNEFKIGERIAKIKDCKHIFFKLDKDHFANLVDQAVEINEGMHPIIHSPWLGYFNEIRNECNMLLHGFSFDILFRGLFIPKEKFKFLKFEKLEKFDDDLSDKILNGLLYNLTDQNPSKLFTDKTNFNYEIENTIKEILEQREDYIENKYNKYDHFCVDSLYRYPSFTNVSCIRPFVEELLVTIDNDVLDVYLKMTPEMRIKTIIWKETIRKLNYKIGNIPDANTGFSPFIPLTLEKGIILGKRIKHKIKYGILNRINSKQRKESDFGDLIRYNKKLKESIREIIYDENAIDPEIFNVEQIKKMFKRHIDRKENNTAFLLLLLTFGKWYKKYGLKN